MEKYIVNFSAMVVFLILAFLALHFVFRIDPNSEPWAAFVLVSIGVVFAYFMTRRENAVG